MPRILITGASGFVGRAASEYLSAMGYMVRGALRSPSACPGPRLGVSAHGNIEVVVVGNIGPETNWLGALRGVDVILHTAARVHVMHETAADPLSEFRQVNVLGTLRLARQAALAGVRRFVFLSSIKVNGESTLLGHPYTADDLPAPLDPYGISKHEAEQGLLQIARETGIEIVVIRPVLIYGVGVKGNFHSMMRWLHKGTPLPLGAIDNRRSLLALDNLVNLIETCLRHSAAANQTFLASDGEDLSVTQLLQRLGYALGTPARLLPVPPVLLKTAAALLGRREVAQRLCGSLQVNIEKARVLLGWSPPITVEKGLHRAAEGFLKEMGA
jgi:nucleoside-diphosphate-sugar epimerase